MLWFDLHNILFLTLPFEFSGEHAGPASQRPDLLKYSALETKGAGNKPHMKTLLKRRDEGWRLSAPPDF